MLLIHLSPFVECLIMFAKLGKSREADYHTEL